MDQDRHIRKSTTTTTATESPAAAVKIDCPIVNKTIPMRTPPQGFMLSTIRPTKSGPLETPRILTRLNSPILNLMGVQECQIAFAKSAEMDKRVVAVNLAEDERRGTPESCYEEQIKVCDEAVLR